jgi:hypothetical protein
MFQYRGRQAAPPHHLLPLHHRYLWFLLLKKNQVLHHLLHQHLYRIQDILQILLLHLHQQSIYRVQVLEFHKKQVTKRLEILCHQVHRPLDYH